MRSREKSLGGDLSCFCFYFFSRVFLGFTKCVVALLVLCVQIKFRKMQCVVAEIAHPFFARARKYSTHVESLVICSPPGILEISRGVGRFAPPGNLRAVRFLRKYFKRAVFFFEF